MPTDDAGLSRQQAGMGVTGGYRGRIAKKSRRGRDPDELRVGERQSGTITGAGCGAGAGTAERVLARASVTVGRIPVAECVEVRASLTRWAGRELAHFRTWFEGHDGRWRPTRRGVTVAPDRLALLESIVREMREAYAAGVLGPGGPPAASASVGSLAGTSEKPDKGIGPERRSGDARGGEGDGLV